MCFQNCVDGFFFRPVDERASVKNQNICFLSVTGDFHTLLQNASKHDLRIDEVFRAAEADHADFCDHWYRMRRSRYSTVTSVSPSAISLPFFVIWMASRSRTRTAM